MITKTDLPLAKDDSTSSRTECDERDPMREDRRSNFMEERYGSDKDSRVVDSIDGAGTGLFDSMV